MKWFICSLCIFLIVALEICESGKTVVTGQKGACECGVFEKLNISTEDKAIIQQSPLNVTCDFEGYEVCQSICSALAEAARAKGPTLLCASVLNVNDLKVSVFARSCFEKNWVYTNLTSPDPICCQNGEPVSCEEKETGVDN